MEANQAVGARLARRDAAALEEAYTAYAPSILSFLRRYVGADEAEDVLQRTFLDAWRNAHHYDPEQRLSAWLYTIAHRSAVDALRSRRHDIVPVEVVRDLVGHIDATCRTIAAREGRLLDGFSMGVVARRAWASSIPNCSTPSRSWAPGRRSRRSPARQGPASSGPRTR